MQYDLSSPDFHDNAVIMHSSHRHFRRVRTISQHLLQSRRLRQMSTSAKKMEDPKVVLSGTDGHSPVAVSATSSAGGKTRKIVVNRPEKLNSLNREMVKTLDETFCSYQKDSNVRCILLEGTGRAFCAGGDVDAIRSAVISGESSLPADFFYEEYILNHRISQGDKSYDTPQIAIWDGFVMGGGVGISAHGKFRIATERSVFAMPETGIGLFPDVGGTYALPRVRGGLSMGLFIGLTGVRLKAADLLYSGLATHYCPSSKLPQLRETLERESFDGVSSSSVAVDRVLREISGSDDAKIDRTQASLFKNGNAIARCFGQESLEKVFEALEAERDLGTDEASKEWASSTLETMQKMSPLSMRVTFEALRRNCPAREPNRTLAEALRVEYRLAQRFMRTQPGSDFCEGIRAVLVDKDHSPKWTHASVGDVTDEEVDFFFSSLPSDHTRGELAL